MKKYTKRVLLGVILAALLSAGATSAFAAGYDVVKDPWLEDVTSTEIRGDEYYSYEKELTLCPTPFINGVSTVYNDVWIVPGEWVEEFCRGYYLVDESGNISELKTDIGNSAFGNANIYDWADKESNQIFPDYYLKYPEEYGFKVDQFDSDKYYGGQYIENYDQITGRYDSYRAYVNDLAAARYNEDDTYCGVVDKNDNIIVPFIYDQIGVVGHNGYTWVRKDGKWGIIKVNTKPVFVKVNEKELSFDQIPLIINGRTLAPLRAIFEALGAEVDWNGETQTITSSKGDTTVSMTIGHNEMYKNGEKMRLDEAPQIVGERTLVPVRAIAEAFDCNVDWNAETNTVIIKN